MSTERSEQTNVTPIYRPGDEVVFHLDTNMRATVEGFEIVNGVLWVEVSARVSFTLPASHVIHVERSQNGGSPDAA